MAFLYHIATPFKYQTKTVETMYINYTEKTLVIGRYPYLLYSLSLFSGPH